MTNEASALWKDGPYAGMGQVTVPSGVLSDTKYVLASAAVPGRTNPVELLGAAIAMAVSATIAIKMGNLGARPAAIETHAAIKVHEAADRWKIVAVHLEIAGQVSDADIDVFRNAVEEAQADCPIASELNLPVSYSTKLVSVGSQMAA